MLLIAFTLFHTALSLVGIGAGFVVMYEMLSSKPTGRWTGIFLWSTVATSVTGFFFPVREFLPSHAVGIISLIVLTFALLARYRHHLSGGWRRTYVITSVVALYLNFFVLIVQLFRRVPPLREIAPTQSEPPFQIAQLVALILFAVLGFRAAIRFRDELPRRA